MTIEVPTIALFVALIVPLGVVYWWAVNKYWYPWTDRKLNAWLESARYKRSRVEMTLLKKGHLTLSSGRESEWKIDCDAFTHADWLTCVWLITQRRTFGRVIGIERGGTYLARCLEEHADPKSSMLLIVDDVITTGDSFRTAALDVDGPYSGACVFGRGDPDMYPSWVLPLFQVNQWFTSL